MASSFQISGSLQDVPLFDIARLLQSTRRTGCLSLNPEGAAGAIYFEKGQIVDAQSNQLSGMDAIRHLALFNRGTFEFVDNVAGPNRALAGQSTAEIINALEERIQEARQIQELMPKFNEIPHYTGGALPTGFELNAAELAVAMKASSGTLTVARIAHNLGLDRTMVSYTVARFRAMGLIEMRGTEGEEDDEPPPSSQPSPGAAPAGGGQPRYWRGRRVE